MSTENIVSISPVMAGLVPVAVDVTFRVHGAEETRTYRYSTPEAVAGILQGSDPNQWSGTRIDGGSTGSASSAGMATSIGEDISEAVTDISEIGSL